MLSCGAFGGTIVMSALEIDRAGADLLSKGATITEMMARNAEYGAYTGGWHHGRHAHAGRWSWRVCRMEHHRLAIHVKVRVVLDLKSGSGLAIGGKR